MTYGPRSRSVIPTLSPLTGREYPFLVFDCSYGIIQSTTVYEVSRYLLPSSLHVLPSPNDTTRLPVPSGLHSLTRYSGGRPSPKVRDRVSILTRASYCTDLPSAPVFCRPLSPVPPKSGLNLSFPVRPTTHPRSSFRLQPSGRPPDTLLGGSVCFFVSVSIVLSESLVEWKRVSLPLVGQVWVHSRAGFGFEKTVRWSGVTPVRPCLTLYQVLERGLGLQERKRERPLFCQWSLLWASWVSSRTKIKSSIRSIV